VTKATGIEEYSNGVIVHDFTRTWEVQSKAARPWHAPLAFRYESRYIGGSFTDKFDVTQYYGTYRLTMVNDYTQDVINKCYGNFVAQLGSSSQMVNNLLEGKQSVGMIAQRALQVAGVFNNLRKGNVAGAMKSMGRPPGHAPKGLKGAGKSVADQFLELHFGWQPLLQDIHNSMQTLSNPNFEYHKVQSRANYSDLAVDRHVHDYIGFGVYKSWTDIHNSTFSCKMGARVRVSNPNAYLANQMGLINPASIAWEAVPFSFVADWFSNVGQCLSSMTDFVGIDLVDAYTTTSFSITQDFQELFMDNFGETFLGQGRFTGKWFRVIRGAGISGPKFSVRPFEGLGLTRAATAISLVVQSLLKH
jgi:hypothetical protein